MNNDKKDKSLDEAGRLLSKYGSLIPDTDEEYSEAIKTEQSKSKDLYKKLYGTGDDKTEAQTDLKKPSSDKKEPSGPKQKPFGERENQYFDLANERQQLQREQGALQSEGRGVNYERLQDISGRLDVIKDDINDMKPDGAGVRLVNAFNGFIQGATEVPVGLLQGIATTAKWMDNVAGTNVQPGDVDEQTLYVVGQKLRELAKENFDTDPVLMEEFTQQLSQGLGSFLGFAGGGAITRILSGSLRSGQFFSVGAAGFGGSAGAYEEAKQNNASEADAQLASKWGFIPGVVQVSNTALRVLNRWDRAYGGALKENMARRVLESGKSGINEAIVESLGQAGFNKIAQEIHDAERPITEGLFDAGAVGGSAGFLSDLILTGLGGRAARMRGPNQQAQAEAEAENEAIREEVENRKPIQIGSYEGQDVKIVGRTSEGDMYIELPGGKQKLVEADAVEDIISVSAEEQVEAELENRGPVEGEGNQAGEQELELEMIVDPETKEYLYPGDEGYDAALDKIRKLSEKKTTLTIGKGSKTRNADIRELPDGSFTVDNVDSLQRKDEDGNPVRVSTSELNRQEIDDLMEDISAELGSEGDYVIEAFPTDPTDTFSPMEVFIAPSDSEMADQIRQEKAVSEYEVQADGTKLKVVNPEGKEVSKQSKYYLPTLVNYFKGAAEQYNSMEWMAENDPNVNEHNFIDEVSRYSENPLEIAEAYEMALENEEINNHGSLKETSIAEDLANSRIPSSDLQRRGLDGQVYYAQYASKRADTDIAQRAEYLSDQTGMEITVDDIMDFIRENPGGPKSALDRKSEEVQKVEDRFEEVTGVEITKGLANALVDSPTEFSDEGSGEGFVEPDIDVARQQELESMSDEELSTLESELLNAGIQREEIDRINRQAETATEQEIADAENAVENAESEAEALQELEDFFDKQAQKDQDDDASGDVGADQDLAPHEMTQKQFKEATKTETDVDGQMVGYKLTYPDGTTGNIKPAKRSSGWRIDLETIERKWKDTIVKANEAGKEIPQPVLDEYNNIAREQSRLPGGPKDLVNKSKPSRREELSDKEAKVKDELSSLFDEFNDQIGGQANVGFDPKLIELSAKIIGKGGELGYVKFQQFAQFVIDNKGEDFFRKIFQNFKAAYTSAVTFENNPNNEDLNALGKATADDFISAETEAESRESDTGDSDLSSTQFNISGDIAERAVEFSQSIPQSEIYEDGTGQFGREDEPHVTLFYGLTENNPQAVQEVLSEAGEVEVVFGETSLFEGENYDVLKVEVEGERIRELHERIKEELPNETTYPDYSPHMTIAYMKQGEGEKYSGDNRFEGETVTLSEVIHSSPEREKTEISLISETTQQEDSGVLTEQQYVSKYDLENETGSFQRDAYTEYLSKQENIPESILDTLMYSDLRNNIRLARKFFYNYGFKLKKSAHDAFSKRMVNSIRPTTPMDDLARYAANIVEIDGTDNESGVAALSEAIMYANDPITELDQVDLNFTPKDDWQNNLIKAREYARALNIDHSGKDLESLVNEVTNKSRKVEVVTHDQADQDFVDDSDDFDQSDITPDMSAIDRLNNTDDRMVAIEALYDALVEQKKSNPDSIPGQLTLDMETFEAQNELYSDGTLELSERNDWIDNWYSTVSRYRAVKDLVEGTVLSESSDLNIDKKEFISAMQEGVNFESNIIDGGTVDMRAPSTDAEAFASVSGTYRGRNKSKTKGNPVIEFGWIQDWAYDSDSNTIYAHIEPEGAPGGKLSDIQDASDIIDAIDRINRQSLDPNPEQVGLFDDNSAADAESSQAITEVESLLMQDIKEKITSKEPMSKSQLDKLAKDRGITSQKRIKELAELAIIDMSREFATNEFDTQTAFGHMVNIYENQPNLTGRTSTSVMLQQYSTPVPFSYMMGVYTNIDEGVAAFEPSAGNGMLTVAAGKRPSNVISNEIDADRLDMLREQGFHTVMSQDGTLGFDALKNTQQAMLTNPPFGKTDARFEYDIDGRKGEMTKLEHVMSAKALETIRDDGKAAILIGGNDSFSDTGARTGQDAVFFHWLYHNYNVEDVINIGRSMYSKQGASVPVRIILINKRKPVPSGFAPINKDGINVINSFQEFYERVEPKLTRANHERITQQQLDTGSTPSESVPGRPGESGESTDLFGSRTDSEGGTGTDSGRGAESQQDGTGDASGTGSGTGRGRQTEGDSTGSSGQRQIQDSDQRSETTDGESTGSGRSDEQGRVERDIPTEKSTLGDRVTASDVLEADNSNISYSPLSDSGIITTEVPASMAMSMYKTLENLGDQVGNVDAFVMEKLGYNRRDDLYEALAAEQIDAVALAIKQVERGKSLIVGDQTGIGKGRVAASMIRYAINEGITPVFFTEKDNLFSDMYRDLTDIGSDYKPFIVNNGVNISDSEGNTVYKSDKRSQQNKVFNDPSLLSNYDYVAVTYSQIQNLRSTKKRGFIESIADQSMIIMDESHNASGSSNTGEFFLSILPETKGAVYLSATFAKRPDNFPVYAVKTDISDVAMNTDEMIEAIESGGVALQEILSSDLVESGQMVRRQRSFKGVKREFDIVGTDENGTLDELGVRQRELYDQVSSVMREIIYFQETFVADIIADMDKDAKDEGYQIDGKKGAKKAGVDNPPFVSRIHNIVDQVLFSIKVDAVADEAIRIMESNRKPVIAVKSTMEAILDDTFATGESVEGLNFGIVMERALKSVMKYSKKDAITGDSIPGQLTRDDLGRLGKQFYDKVVANASEITQDLAPSPIDHLISKLSQAGYNIGEVTGRSRKIELNPDGTGTVMNRTKKEKDKTTLYREFNEGGLDGLIINSSGATGASAHASEKFGDQRQRVMIIHQPELNINTEVQKWGRIFRTGQVVLPEYKYITSSIPAETRLMMVLKRKIKSLDANTTSSQDTSSDFLEMSDFMNKYGDYVVTQYLKDNPDLHQRMQSPISSDTWQSVKDGSVDSVENISMKASGRVALLDSSTQENFYETISEQYQNYIDMLNEYGENELVMDNVDLQAETVEKNLLVKGDKPETLFGGNSYLEKVKARVLKKPMKKDEIDDLIADELSGEDAEAYQDRHANDSEAYIDSWLRDMEAEINARDASDDAKAESLDKARDKAEQWKRNTSKKLFNRFTPGKVYVIPADSQAKSGMTKNAVFIGFGINENAKNPYAPSSIKLKFVTNDAQRSVNIPGSNLVFINSAVGDTMHLSSYAREEIFNRWDDNLNTKNTEERFIATGNVLQALGSLGNKGQLIQYTTKDGDVQNGVILPRNISDQDLGKLKNVRVRAINAEQQIFDLSQGYEIEMTGNIAFRRGWDGKIRLIVPSSKVRGGRYYTDEKLLELLGDFVKSGSEMRATVPAEKVGKVLRDLTDRFNIYAEVPMESVDQSDDVRFRLSDKQTETDEFKAWFGDSKAVKDSGKAQPMYHGSSVSDIESFDSDINWFTPDINFSKEYTYKTDPNIYEVFLKAEKPFVLKSQAEREVSKDYLINQLKKEHDFSSVSKRLLNRHRSEINDALKALQKSRSLGYRIDKLPIYMIFKQPSSVELLKNFEYDSITWREKVSKRDNETGNWKNMYSDTWGVFNPNQIKSATDNIGAFDSSSPNIRLSKENYLTDILDSDGPVLSLSSQRKRKNIRKAIQEVTSTWANDDFVNVVDTIHDLPSSLTQRFIKLGMENTVSGVYTDNQIYIVADNNKTVKDAKDTLFHEAFGHLGLRSFVANLSYNVRDYEGRLNSILKDVHDSFKDDPLYKRISDKYDLDFRKPEDRYVAAEEFMARVAEGDLNPTLWDRLVKLINDVMKAVGYTGKAYTLADVKDLMSQAKSFIEGDSYAVAMGDGSHIRTAFMNLSDPSQRLTDGLFRSNALEGLAEIKQNAATPHQWVKMIADRGGRGTKQELEWIGLEDYLNEYMAENDSKSVPSEVVNQYIRDNQIQIEEVELQSLGFNPENIGDLETELMDLGYQFEQDMDGGFTIVDMNENTIEYDSLPENAQEVVTKLERALNEDGLPKEGEARYGEYTLPGGENYRELLLTLPLSQRQDANPRALRRYNEEMARGNHAAANRILEDVGLSEEPTFTNRHFDEPNILAHVRVNDRTLPNGENVLFIEEMQSDWAQEGREKGFTDKSGLRAEKAEADGVYLVYRGNEFINNVHAESESDAINNVFTNAVPDMPYKKTDQWAGMAIRRMMAMATEQGYDRIAWTTGEQQADRYDLSKQVREIKLFEKPSYSREGDTPGGRRLVVYDTTNRVVVDKVLSDKQIEEHIGKEAAQNLINQELKNVRGSEYRSLQDNELKVGGEGMKGFYNNIVPKIAKKEAKRFDKKAKVDVVEIVLSDELTTEERSAIPGLIDQFESGDITKKAFEKALSNSGLEATYRGEGVVDGVTKVEKDTSKQLSVKLSDAAKESLRGAVPLFRLNDDDINTPEFKEWFGDSKVVDGSGNPIVVYHGTPDSRGIREGFQSDAERLLGKEDPEKAFFFTDNKRMADSYADDRRAFDYQNAVPETLRTYLSIENPLQIDAKGQRWDKFEFTYKGDKGIGTKSIVRLAKKHGHDGIVVNNVKDHYNNTESSMAGTVYAAFDSTQVKSATENTGTFDSSNPDIRMRLQDKKVPYIDPRQLESYSPQDEATVFGEEGQAEENRRIVAEEARQKGVQGRFDFGDEAGQDDLDRAPTTIQGLEGTVYKRGIIDGFEESGYVNMLGTKINNAQDIADLYSIHRSPLIEKFHYIGLDENDRIVYSNALTSNASSYVSTPREYHMDSYSEMADAGVKKVVLLHNHPSGDPDPSRADIRMTKAVAKLINTYSKDTENEMRLVEHVVLNGDEFTSIKPNGLDTRLEYRNKPQNFFKEGRDQHIYNNPDDVAELGKRILDDDQSIAAVYLNRGKTVVGYDLFPISAGLESDLVKSFNHMSDNVQSDGVVYVGNQDLIDKHVTKVEYPHNIIDAIGFKDGSYVSERTDNPNSKMFGDARQASEVNESYRLWEPSVEYNRGDASDDASVSDTRMRLQSGDRLEDHGFAYQKRFDRIKRVLQDSGVAAKRMTEGVKKEGGQLTDQNDFYQDETLAKGRTGERLHQFNKGLRKELIEVAQKGNEEEGITHDDYHKYLYARHAIEANQYLEEQNPDAGDAQSGMTNSEALEILTNVVDKGWQQHMDEFADVIDRMHKKNLINQLAYGLISKQRYGQLRKMYDYYVPLRGFEDFMDVDPTMYTPDISRSGRSSKAGDTIAYSLAMFESTIIRGERNLVKQKILKFAEDNHTRSELMEIENVYWLDTGVVDPETGRNKYIAQFEKPSAEDLLTGKVVREINPDTSIARWEESENPFQDNRVKVMVEGKPVVVRFKDPHIAEWINGSDKESMNIVTKILPKYMSFLRKAYITYSPEFPVRNLFRDGTTGVVHIATDFDAKTAAAIGNPLRIAKNSLPSLWKGLYKNNFEGEWGSAVKKFLDKGAVSGYYQLSPLKRISKDLQKDIETHGDAWYKTKSGLKNFGEVMQAYTSTVENAIRISAFKYFLDNDVINPKTGEPFTEKQAAKYAKDLTVNFNRKGSAGPEVGAYYIFFNATLQGIARMAEPFFEGGTRRRARAAAVPLVMGSVAYAATDALRLFMGVDDDDEYKFDKINDFTVAHRWMIPNFFSEDEDALISVPLPYGLNAYWAAGVYANKVANNTLEAGDAAIKMAQVAWQAYNPIGGELSSEGAGYSAFKTLLPTVAIPPFEYITNRDFRGQPITPERFPYGPQAPESENFRFYTGEWAKKVARGLNRASGGDKYTSGLIDFSPNNLEHFVNSYLGGAGNFGISMLKTGEQLAHHALGEENVTADDIRRFPGARIFFSGVPRSAQRTRYIENHREIDQLEWKHDQILKDDGFEKAESFWEENAELLELMPLKNRVQTEVNRRFRALNSVPRDDREASDQLLEEISELYSMLNREVNRVKGSAASQNPVRSLDVPGVRPTLETFNMPTEPKNLTDILE